MRASRPSLCRRQGSAAGSGLLVVFFAANAFAAPDDLVQRRAIRGKPVESGRESPELRALREFEDEAFSPRAPVEPADDAQAGLDPRRVTGSLGTDGVGPDALPPELRSPEAARAPVAAPAAAIPWLDELKLPDMPVRLDPRVVRYLEFYKSDKRGRAILGSWLRAQGRYKTLIDEALRRAKLPLALGYVAMIESGYDPLDKSHAGAVGLWQLMPEGGRIYGLRVDHWIDERRDPEKATDATMRYLADLKERFGGWPLALAAFNAGYGAVLRSIQKYNTNDYWELCRHENGLPWDTVLYVPKVMATAIVGENRPKFGYDTVRPDPAFTYERVSVSSSMSFAAIARAAGVTPPEISALNPELRRGRTPPSLDGNAFALRVPRGSAARFTAGYESNKERLRPFVVRFGERLDDLARAYSMEPKKLRAINGIEDSSEVRPGLVLLVPEGTPKPPAPTPCDTVIVPVPDKDLVVAGKKRIFYRTVAHDTPREVASFFKVKPADLAKWNHLDLDAKLAGAMVLQLWVERDFDESQAALVPSSRVRLVTLGSDEFFDLVEARRGRVRLQYVVKKGDDYKKIGKRFGLTVPDLERINRMHAASTPLKLGHKLTVYRAMTKAEKDKAACQIAPSVPVTVPAESNPDDPPPEEEGALPRPPPLE